MVQVILSRTTAKKGRNPNIYIHITSFVAVCMAFERFSCALCVRIQTLNPSYMHAPRTTYHIPTSISWYIQKCMTPTKHFFLRELSNKYTANEHTEFFEAKNEF